MIVNNINWHTLRIAPELKHMFPCIITIVILKLVSKTLHLFPCQNNVKTLGADVRYPPVQECVLADPTIFYLSIVINSGQIQCYLSTIESDKSCIIFPCIVSEYSGI